MCKGTGLPVILTAIRSYLRNLLIQKIEWLEPKQKVDANHSPSEPVSWLQDSQDFSSTID